MELTRLLIDRERQTGDGAGGIFCLGDVRQVLPGLVDAYAGKVQSIYIDPPFLTGKRFVMRTRVGEKDWKTGLGSFVQTAYEDDLDAGDYMDMMRAVLTGARELLTDTGVMFLHIDYRMHARMRLLMDEIFGEENLLNEIVWAYQSGGRARRYFSRKHDTILFYKKNARYYFDLKATGVVLPGGRSNHMKKSVDPDGRVYRSIRSGGKIYTYYDDDPVYPGDVWDDVSHLQQKDPQRTGYDTQKPMRLLERVISCSTRPGDMIADLFAGSGTTMAAAHALGRAFLGVDSSPLSLQTVRRRLECERAGAEYRFTPCEGAPLVRARGFVGVGYYEIELTDYQIEAGVAPRAFAGFDALDNWAVGYVRGGAFQPMAMEGRTKGTPGLKRKLKLPVLTGAAVLRTGDVLGRVFYYELDKDGMQS